MTQAVSQATRLPLFARNASHSKVSFIFFFTDQVFVLLNLFPGVRESVLVFPDAVNDLK